jgi:hypothetical protein
VKGSETPLPIAELIDSIRKLYPNTVLNIDFVVPDKNVWLVIGLNDHWLEVEFFWRIAGFGVSILDDNVVPFTAHVWFFATVAEAKTHILGLLAQFERKNKE